MDESHTQPSVPHIPRSPFIGSWVRSNTSPCGSGLRAVCQPEAVSADSKNYVVWIYGLQSKVAKSIVFLVRWLKHTQNITCRFFSGCEVKRSVVISDRTGQNILSEVGELTAEGATVAVEFSGRVDEDNPGATQAFLCARHDGNLHTCNSAAPT